MDIDTKDNAPANNQSKDEDNAEQDLDEETATESERASTPQPLEDEETASEEEGPDVRPDVPVPTRPSAPSKGDKQRAAPAEEQSSRSTGRTAGRKPTSSPPPRRELPFARRGGNSKSAPAPKPKPKPDENEVETESDDDL